MKIAKKIEQLRKLKAKYKSERKMLKYLELCSRLRVYEETPNLCPDYVHEPEEGNMCLSQTGLIECILAHEKLGYNCPNRKGVHWAKNDVPEEDGVDE